jgi:hypothetical protein
VERKMSCPVQNHPSQVRATSDLSQFSDIAMAISKEIIHQIRFVAFAFFEQYRELCQADLVTIPITVEKWDSIINEATTNVQTNDPLLCSRKDLVRTAEKVVREFYQTKSNFKAPRGELEKFPNLFRDDRLLEWSKFVQQKLIQFLEEKNGSKTIQIPKEQERISCYRYALTTAGVEINGILDRDKLIKIIFSRDFQVVKEPNRGDLVLFLDGDEPKHLGIYQENGYVLSKEGDQCPIAYIKPLTDFTREYGNNVLFLNKLVLAKIQGEKQSQNHFT